jgi:hypothetical protein
MKSEKKSCQSRVLPSSTEPVIPPKGQIIQQISTIEKTSEKIGGLIKFTSSVMLNQNSEVGIVKHDLKFLKHICLLSWNNAEDPKGLESGFCIDLRGFFSNVPDHLECST